MYYGSQKWISGKLLFLYCLPGSGICPMCVEEFLGVRPDSQRGLLVHQDGSWLSLYQSLVVFRRCLRALGLKEREF